VQPRLEAIAPYVGALTNVAVYCAVIFGCALLWKRIVGEKSVAVEKLFSAKSAEITSRQDAL